MSCQVFGTQFVNCRWARWDGRAIQGTRTVGRPAWAAREPGPRGVVRRLGGLRRRGESQPAQDTQPALGTYIAAFALTQDTLRREMCHRQEISLPRFASGGGCRTVWCGVWLPYAGLGGLAQRTGATEPYSQRPVYIHMHLSAHGCTGRASDVKHRDFRCVCAVGDERPPAGHQRRPQRASRVSEPVPQRRQHAAPRQHARFLPVVARLHPAPCVQG
jgi:hypothetical protein